MNFDIETRYMLIQKNKKYAPQEIVLWINSGLSKKVNFQGLRNLTSHMFKTDLFFASVEHDKENRKISSTISRLIFQ